MTGPGSTVRLQRKAFTQDPPYPRSFQAILPNGVKVVARRLGEGSNYVSADVENDPETLRYCEKYGWSIVGRVAAPGLGLQGSQPLPNGVARVEALTVSKLNKMLKAGALDGILTEALRFEEGKIRPRSTAINAIRARMEKLGRES